MNSIANFDTPVLASSLPLEVSLINGFVQAGFPSPAEDLGAKRLDLTQLLIKHSQATYFLRASGHSMKDAGIFDGDILVVDKAIKPRNNHIVVAIVDGDFTVKQLYQRAGHTKLKSANPTYPDVTPKEGQTIEVWGVVTSWVFRATVTGHFGRS